MMPPPQRRSPPQRAMLRLTNTKVASPLKGVKIEQTDPLRTLDEAPKWSKLFDETVLKKAGRP